MSDTTTRQEVKARDRERRDARERLLNQLDDTRDALSPSHLASLWKAQQVRRISRGRDAATDFATDHPGLLAGAVASVVALFAGPPLIRRWRRDKRRQEEAREVFDEYHAARDREDKLRKLAKGEISQSNSKQGK